MVAFFIYYLYIKKISVPLQFEKIYTNLKQSEKPMGFKNQYETTFILTPVLAEAQLKDAVEKYKTILTNNGAEMVHEENWGLRKLAYQINKKSTGFYYLLEFKAEPTVIAKLELEYRRDEKVLRFLTISLDKFAIEFNEKKRKGLIGKREESKEVSVA